MSEDPPIYSSRVFVCRVCRQAFTPSGDELAALLALERNFGLPAERAEMVCAQCEGKDDARTTN